MTGELVERPDQPHLIFMSTLSNIAIAGIRAAETRFAARAETVANANNQAYPATRTEQISTAIGPVARASRSDKPRPNEPQRSDADLAEALAGLVSIRYDFRASVKLLRTADELSGSLLDILA